MEDAATLLHILGWIKLRPIYFDISERGETQKSECTGTTKVSPLATPRRRFPKRQEGHT